MGSEFIGAVEFLHRIDSSIDAAARDAETAVDSVASAVVAAARRRVPKRTHRLEKSIQVHPGVEERDAPACEVIADQPYAADVEFGNLKRGAEPFMRPAAKKEGTAALNEAADAANRDITQALKGY